MTERMTVYGIVQGVGFRPTVSRHAAACGVTGSVCNKGPYVEIFAQGDEKALELFKETIEKEPPERAVILKLDCNVLENSPVYDRFSIIESEKEKGEILIPPDIAICEECKRELFDRNNRRYLHPFINCTCCGPRLTILDALPYDRERTSMKVFPMCSDCEEEYHNPKSRRYDAQPVCCNNCGPQVYLLGRSERGGKAITEARRIIRDGGIVAVKGIGGFHLCCDAANENAVARMRSQKNRPQKPFAVMMRDMDTVYRECEVTKAQERVLCGHQKPIVLLKKKKDTHLCPSVAPGNPKAGVMLPYAPIHLLLFTYDDDIVIGDALVMTSGNISGAPICREEEDAIAELSGLCDAILSHNRKIRMRADDSVMDFYGNREYMIRRSRGYAPLPYYVTGRSGNRQVLAMGGELKNSFCIGTNQLFYMSPYIGDMEDIRTVEALKESVERFSSMLEVSPQVIACDLHPRYNTTLMAESYGLPIVRVQHHYAHIVSCMAENDYLEPVIGVSMDGTGYGTDGTIWGGELLLADVKGFERVGHIVPFLQIGGDVSAKEGWRIAVSMIYELMQKRISEETEDAGQLCTVENSNVEEMKKEAKQRTLVLIKKLGLCSEAEASVLLHMHDRKLNAVVSTSAGRLFDAVSAILGIRRCSTFEGEASTALQFAAESYKNSVNFSDTDDGALIKTATSERNGAVESQNLLSTDEIVKTILSELQNGTDVGKLAYDFHETLATQIAHACVQVRQTSNRNVVALSGGCFQNLLLLDMCKSRLEKQGFRVLIHHLVPPNDGGIALGQAVVAMNAYVHS